MSRAVLALGAAALLAVAALAYDLALNTPPAAAQTAPVVMVTTSCGQAVVSWDAVPGATSYTLSHTSSAETGQLTATSPHTQSGLTPGVEFTITVTVNGGPNNSQSGTATGTPGAAGCDTAPAPMVTLNAPAASCGELSISWDAIDGASGYTVSWLGGGMSGTLTDTSIATTRSATGLPAGESIIVSVRVDGGASDMRTGSATAETQNSGCAPVVPAVTFSSVTDSSFTANWPTYTGATGQAEARLYIGTTEPAVPSGETPCSSADTTTNPIICFRATTDNPTTASYSFFIDAGTLYTLDVWKTVSGTWTKIATGTVTTTGTFTPVSPTVSASTGDNCGEVEVLWDAVVDAEGWTVTWTAPGGISGTSGRLDKARLSHRFTEASLTSGETVSVTVTLHGGRSDGQTATATAAASTTGCGGRSTAVTISAVTASGFTASWVPHPGNTGGHAVRISEGTEAIMAVPTADAYCGTDDVARATVSCVAISTVGVHEAVVTGLSAETDYFLQVLGSVGGQAEIISTGPARTAAEPTGPAPTVTVTAGTGCGDLGVSWNALTGASGYIVTWETGVADFTLTETIDGGSTTSYTITGLPQSRDTGVTVTAVGGDSGGAVSTEMRGAAGSTGCPLPVVSVTAFCRSLTVRWTAVPGAEGYNIAIVGGSLNQDSGSGDLVDTLTGLTAGTEYTITIRVLRGPSTGLSASVMTTPGTAACTTGERAPQFDIPAGTDPDPGTDPAPMPESTDLALRVRPGPGCGEVGVRWDAVAEAESYTVAWSTSGTSPDDSMLVKDGVFYLIEHDWNGIDITVTVTANGTEDEVMESVNTTTGYTGSCDDGLNVTASGPNCGAISIRWNATAGATNYQVSWNPLDNSRSRVTETIAPTSAVSYRQRVSGLGAGTVLDVSVVVVGGDYSGETGSTRVRSGTCASQTPIIPFTPSVSLPEASQPSVDLNEPSHVQITLSDSDGVVRPGATVTATAEVVNTQGGALSGAAPYEWSISGRALEFNNAASGSSSRFRISIPSNTPDGLYTIHATGRGVSGVASLLVDDPGEPIGGIALALGRRGDDGRCTLGDSSAPPDSSTARPGAEICLVARVLNTLGNVTNSNDVELVTVRAPGGSINGGGNVLFVSSASQAGFTVSSATEGTVTVSATASGVNDIEARTVSLTLTFSAEAGNHEGAGYEEEGLHCLTRLAQFAVWVCEVPILASALFDEVDLVGVTAVHRWNETESRWQRYSTVAGQPIPGSEDFVIGRGQVLFFSH